MEKLSRRSFLKAGAAAVAPLVLPSGVLARPGQPGANDKIVLGFIGVGGWGTGLMRQMKEVHPAAAICDVDTDHLASAATWFDEDVDQYGDYRRVLDRADIDAVVIATPDQWHAIQAVHAMEAGKDVYVEKPLSRTIAEGQAVVETAERCGAVLQMGTQGRSQPDPTGRSDVRFHQACNFIRNGGLGQVTRVECWHPGNPIGPDTPDEPPPSHLDWDMWLGPARWAPYNSARCPGSFRFFMEYGGGVLRDFGAHVLSNALWFLDRDGDGPVRVSATGKRPPSGLYDAPLELDVTWEFEDPDLTITWRQHGDFPSDHWGGAALYHGTDRSLLVAGSADEAGAGVADEEVREYEPPPGGVNVFRSPGHHQNWFDCIKSRETPVMPAASAHRVTSLCILGNAAWQLGRPLEFDPVAQRAVGDEQANMLLTRPGRGPWHV